MGYTHYWKALKPLKVTPVQKALIAEVLSDHASILKGWDGTGNVESTSKVLSFNGDAKDDLDHETFTVEFGKAVEFAFCKTAGKPYDIAVCKILLILSLSDGFSFSSDGAADGKLVDEEWPNAQLWFVKKGFADTLEKKVLPALKD